MDRIVACRFLCRVQSLAPGSGKGNERGAEPGATWWSPIWFVPER